MKKKLSTTIDLIHDIHKKMKKNIIDSGVQEPKYNFMLKNLEKQSEEYQLILLTYLERLLNNEYKYLMQLLVQMPEHAWENYKILKIGDLPELKWLKDRQRTLRTAFFNWPRPAKLPTSNRLIGKNIILKDEEESA